MKLLAIELTCAAMLGVTLLSAAVYMYWGEPAAAVTEQKP